MTNNEFTDRSEKRFKEKELDDLFEQLSDETLRKLWLEGLESGEAIELDFSVLKAEARRQQKT